MTEPKPTKLQTITPCPVCDKYMYIEIGMGKVKLTCNCGSTFETAFEAGWIDKWNQYAAKEPKPTDKVKPCPFCQSTNHPYHKEGCFVIAINYTSTIEAWNTRPIEDAQASVIADLTEDAKSLQLVIDAQCQTIEAMQERIKGLESDLREYQE